MGISPMRVRYAGRDSLAPKVSLARTAYPSTLERGNSGRGCGADTSDARTRPRAWRESIETESVRGPARCERRIARASSGGRRVRNSGIVVCWSASRLVGWSAEEEGEGEEVGGQGEEGGRVDGQWFPQRRRAEGDVAKQGDLENRKRSGEEGRPDERKGDAEERREGKEEEREQDKSVMKRNGALPGEAREESEAFVFEIVGESGEIENEEGGKSERGDRESENRE